MGIKIKYRHFENQEINSGKKKNKAAEPARIHNPLTGDLIRDKHQIKTRTHNT